ncbi:MAG: TAXI family TRAP transporter solute-binding subunit [Rhizomicrobium sp.]
MRRLWIVAVFGAGLGLILVLNTGGLAQGLPQRVFFQIATGSTGGTSFPIGELIAEIVSHPSGLGRCETRGVCGPPGLIVSARSSDGAIANLLAVDAGSVDSGLAQNNVVADAIAGRGAFRSVGRQTHLRVIASLFPETVQLAVATKSHIAKVGDLRGKRVVLGADGSGTGVIAREVLSAYGVSERSVKVRRDAADHDADLIHRGQIDAFFFVGGSPAPLIADLLASGKARLVPIDGGGRRALLKRVPSLTADAIPAGVYPGTGTLQSVSGRALWVVKDTAAPEIVYGLVRALFNPANRALLDDGPASASRVRLEDSTNGITAPLHPGALRFYREMKLPLAPQRHRP